MYEVHPGKGYIAVSDGEPSVKALYFDRTERACTYGRKTETSPGHRLDREPYISDIHTFRFEHAHATKTADTNGVAIMQAVAAVGQIEVALSGGKPAGPVFGGETKMATRVMLYA